MKKKVILSLLALSLPISVQNIEKKCKTYGKILLSVIVEGAISSQLRIPPNGFALTIHKNSVQPHDKGFQIMIKTFLVLLSICVPELVLAQKSNKMDNLVRSVSAYTQNNLKLSSDKLEKATMITYHCGNGTVAPEYHYDYYIIVTNNNVNVKITSGYNGDVKYNQNHAISSSEYTFFLNSLLKQGITKMPNNDPIPDGAGSSDIIVKMKQRVTFSGDEYFDLSITKGGLQDSFLFLLPEHMKRVVISPEQMLE